MSNVTYDIDIDDVTSERIDGTGSFDIIMRSIGAQLEGQWKANRIRDEDYAQVYLAALVEALKQSIGLELGKAGVVAQLAQAEAAKAQAEASRASAQAQLARVQVELEQVKLIVAQKTKIDAEIALLNQKAKTEEAQIRDEVDGVVVTGVVGKQKELQEQQRLGFIRDAEQKAAEIFKDIFSVKRGTDSGEQEAGGFTNPNANEVIRKLVQGIGVSDIVIPSPPPPSP